MLRVEHGQIVRSRREPWAQGQDLLVGLLRLRDVSLALVYRAENRLKRDALGIHFEGFTQLAHRLIVAARRPIDPSEPHVSIQESRFQLDRLEKRGFGPVEFASADIHGAEQPLKTA